MIVPLALLLVAALLGGVTVLPGAQAWSDLRLFAALIGIGAVILLLRLPFRRRVPPPPRWIVVDGSNVLHWDGNVPKVETLRAVLDALAARGFVPVVWFDANVGYLIGSRHAAAPRMAGLLGLPADRVHVMPRGSPADPALIAGAARLGACIVSNDRYRDWQAANPALDLRDRLVPGSLRDGDVVLRLPQDA